MAERPVTKKIYKRIAYEFILCKFCMTQESSEMKTQRKPENLCLLTVIHKYDWKTKACALIEITGGI
jgi:hypothetical protein